MRCCSVLDATVGQKCVVAGQAFAVQRSHGAGNEQNSTAPTRGGILVALAEKHKLPVHFYGVGEGNRRLARSTAWEFCAGDCRD